jgi:hypothetical protein
MDSNCDLQRKRLFLKNKYFITIPEIIWTTLEERSAKDFKI